MENDKVRGYQYNFSKGNAAMHSVEERQRKALTMLAVLRDALGEETVAKAKILNIGCSTGLIDEVLAEQVGSVVGIDIDTHAIQAAQERCAKNNLSFSIGDAMALDYKDNSFDVIVCSQVYEHVPDAMKLMSEIYRTLAPDGVCYFAATNRWCVVEQHYRLPFLSIIPVSWAHYYLRLLGRGNFYHERHLTLSGLYCLVEKFTVDDYTRRMLVETEKFGTSYMVNTEIKRKVSRLFSEWAYWAMPGYVWLLRK